MNYKTNSQKGAALITSLLIVLVISILGVAVSQQVIALRKVSTANYDYSLSINNAESALYEAGAVINNNVLSPDVLKALATEEKVASNWWRDDNEWASAAVVTEVTEGGPAYLIEDSGIDGAIQMDRNDPKRRLYRVTARAAGKGEATAFLQAYYATME